MSRIGKLPVAIPDKVKVAVDGVSVTVEGPKGTLTKNFDTNVSIKVDGDNVIIEPASNSRQSRAMWGTARSIIQGMVEGVVKPFERSLEIEGVGFKAALKGNILDLALGYSHPINYPVPTGITITIDGGTKLKVQGADKHMVGQVAADIKSYYPVEPYKGKGVRIVGEFVRRKEGKKTA
ncbi:50S ribosomal protein L6 [Rubellicoccus peritrichatus]|uniref:Large ribosomal subunit protein uL6 n=1 Tax=Rubellicoccus peritrichatus TaxID=3080537 RepID=A0AAQ3QXB3_9BACT|nr:50S ribosomal protein L6 [Puniceicoccus sp. CR14]WOO43503.1 50S ribosomal protein L6 [Puniceicoccus sp. CR14]